MILKLIVAAVLTGLISGLFITFYELLITFSFLWGIPIRRFLHCLFGVCFVNYLISKDKHIREYGMIASLNVRNFQTPSNIRLHFAATLHA